MVVLPVSEVMARSTGVPPNCASVGSGFRVLAMRPPASNWMPLPRGDGAEGRARHVPGQDAAGPDFDLQAAGPQPVCGTRGWSI